MRVEYRPAALADLENALDYIARDSPSAAIRIIDAIEDACLTTLSAFPSSGKTHEHILPGLRILVVENYRICYFAHPDRIEVLRILHGARALGSASVIRR